VFGFGRQSFDSGLNGFVRFGRGLGHARLKSRPRAVLSNRSNRAKTRQIRNLSESRVELSARNENVYRLSLGTS
jgi:hypothetical protein